MQPRGCFESMVMIAATSKASEGAAGLALIVVLCMAAFAMFQDRPYEQRAPLIIGTIALSLVYNGVRDGSTISIWFIPPIILVLIPSMIKTLKRRDSNDSDDGNA
jgi:hypothetical protein